MDILQWSRHFRCFPGQGRLALNDFMQALQATGYDGIFSLEIFNDQFRTVLPNQIARDGRRSLLWISEQTSATPASTKASYQGFEFLEFAVDEETADQLETVFRQLGFQQHGKHRSKAVSLWHQGDIKLFELNPLNDTQSTGLQRVDHIAQVLPYSQLSTWQLYYCSVFGFEAAEQYDLADPSGLIQSQVVESPDHAIRIALNASQSHTTLANRFLAKYYGGGVQQVAFACDDIVATVRQLQQNGVPLLPIPENYYDDLDARFGLDARFLETLQRYNILYDQNDSGEFLQAYTQTFADRFYFEILERRNYQEFGVVNAPIRLAAQTRLAQGRAR